jgi:hypothetical protein
MIIRYERLKVIRCRFFSTSTTSSSSSWLSSSSSTTLTLTTTTNSTLSYHVNNPFLTSVDMYRHCSKLRTNIIDDEKRIKTDKSLQSMKNTNSMHGHTSCRSLQTTSDFICKITATNHERDRLLPFTNTCELVFLLVHEENSCCCHFQI